MRITIVTQRDSKEYSVKKKMIKTQIEKKSTHWKVEEYSRFNETWPKCRYLIPTCVQWIMLVCAHNAHPVNHLGLSWYGFYKQVWTYSNCCRVLPLVFTRSKWWKTTFDVPIRLLFVILRSWLFFLMCMLWCCIYILWILHYCCIWLHDIVVSLCVCLLLLLLLLLLLTLLYEYVVLVT